MDETERALWAEMKEEYLRGGVSYRRLSEDYNISLNKIEKRAKKEDWTDLRRQTEREAAAKLVKTAATTNAHKRRLVSAALDRLFDKLNIAIEDTASDDLPRISMLTAILSKLQSINEFRSPEDLKEQRARIDALKKNGDSDGGKAIEISVLSGQEYGK